MDSPVTSSHLMSHYCIGGGLFAFKLLWEQVVGQANFRTHKGDGLTTLTESLHDSGGWKMVAKHAVIVEIQGERKAIVAHLRTLKTYKEIHSYLMTQTFKSIDGDHRQSICRVNTRAAPDSLPPLPRHHVTALEPSVRHR
jgi:hypothetical protein